MEVLATVVIGDKSYGARMGRNLQSGRNTRLKTSYNHYNMENR
jgi:hypothetical protein